MESKESNDVAMTFWEHLEELRRRIIIAAIAIGSFTVLCLSFSRPIEKVVMFPLRTSMSTLIANAIDAAVGGDGSIFGFLAITLRGGASGIDAILMKVGPLEGIMAFLKLGVTAGILLALPIIIYQVWAFIFPALNREEKRFAVPLFLIIVAFFTIGAVFAYFIVVPVVLQFSAQLFPEMPNMWDLENYISLVTKLILGFGIAFELPIVMAFLSRIGVINARGFREKQNYALLGICVMSALLTPADPWSMLLMAIPLFILYQLGIFFAYLVEKEQEVYG
ncbi:twin-arginine translocase subunit TatC [Candidatus Poribacteria bacterium]|nr:twin-arginine translocase subunit TatC [Candidatus Poribacteria bacterium]MYA72766.1 twin-arginine translocase subunit TatC [Candidatus Poribacteria bacterium]MYH82313.1 twin-arginine translocase subunit TatC [Candidatus Poribacteria bacterium]MYK92533.1 twin-arginine translocase subunit TatC [Candidatus Poribacteria bacterium]